MTKELPKVGERTKKKKRWRKWRNYARSHRDGSVTKTVVSYPTEKELARLERYRIQNHIDSRSAAIAHLMLHCTKEVDTVKIEMNGETAARAHHMAKLMGYGGLEHWIKETIEQFVEQYWKLADTVDPEDWYDSDNG